MTKVRNIPIKTGDFNSSEANLLIINDKKRARTGRSANVPRGTIAANGGEDADYKEKYPISTKKL